MIHCSLRWRLVEQNSGYVRLAITIYMDLCAILYQSLCRHCRCCRLRLQCALFRSCGVPTQSYTPVTTLTNLSVDVSQCFESRTFSRS